MRAAAPNIEMIAASLRSCNLVRTGGAESSSVAPAEEELSEVSDESAGDGGGEAVAVELDSKEVALPPPCNWERRLDLRVETRKRNLRDAPGGKEDAVCCSDDSCSGIGGSRDDDDDDDDREGSSVDSGSSGSSCISSLSSSAASAASSPGKRTAVAELRDGVCDRCQILVAAGCRSCFMYFMVPKNVNACPRCGDGLLHLGRHGCA